MSFTKLNSFLKRGIVTAGFLLTAMQFTEGYTIEAIEADLGIQTTNLVEVEKTTSSNYTSNKDVEADVLATISANDLGISIFGGQFEETELEPLLIVLDSSKVPDGEGICNSANFTFMDYTSVTNKKSKQYELLNSDLAYTDEETGIRMYDGRICIAVGSFYSKHIGTKINLVMANGSVIECITGDAKSDAHTDSTNRYQAYDGSVVEIIVDKTIFTGTEMYPEGLSGRISKIEIVE